MINYVCLRWETSVVDTEELRSLRQFFSLDVLNLLGNAALSVY